MWGCGKRAKKEEEKKIGHLQAIRQCTSRVLKRGSSLICLRDQLDYRIDRYARTRTHIHIMHYCHEKARKEYHSQKAIETLTFARSYEDDRRETVVRVGTALPPWLLHSISRVVSGVRSDSFFFSENFWLCNY